jgi:predicted RecB family nuclease
MGAMVGAWWCDAEAARSGGSKRDQSLMAEIGRYNEVDCRTMAEMLDWLRRER